MSILSEFKLCNFGGQTNKFTSVLGKLEGVPRVYMEESFFTCVKALAFQALNKISFEAQYKHQSLLFEILPNKLLLGENLPKLQNKCYKVS